MGRADLGLENSPDHAGIAVSDDKTNIACKADLEQWLNHPRDLAKDAHHLVGVVRAWCKVDQLFATSLYLFSY